MIAAIGLDIVDIAGFAEQLADKSSVFAQSVFTDGERRAAQAIGNPAAHLAVRWAAKEAFVKAWANSRRGQAPVLPSIDWRLIEVAADPWQRPTLLLHGEVARACGRPTLHLSLSHDGPTAAAIVIWEAAS
ncbi:MAG: holo-ACP synthase [Myxococcales bacterium]|nr:holo-ACP synthase [Myxococcales bacterium]